MGVSLDRVLSEYNEDSAFTDGDIGQYVLAVVQDTLASSAADGDFASFKVNLNGELYAIDTDGNALLTTIDADTGSIDATLTALSKAEDSVHVSGDQGIMSLAVRDSSGVPLAASGDYIPMTTDDTGRLRVDAQFGAPDNTIDAQSVTVGVTEVALPTTPEPGRDLIIIQNLGSSSIFVGPTGVSVSSGLEISKRSSLEIALGPSVAVFGISGTAGQDIRVFETA